MVALVAALALGATACATSGTDSNAASAAASSTSASAASASAAVCRAADDVRTSLAALQEVDVVQQGTDALEEAFGQLKSDLADLGDAARARYADEVQQVKTDTDAVGAALDQAKANPSAQTVGAAATAARTLVQDTQALLAAVSSSC